ncbi:YceI family protein [Nonomuraea sp. NPDC050547]|uniref:YceI family protein n=1 Tax=Nonomuraea sp. NPDC050547 TaxID=3364368 RepID=UPI0037AF6A80
MTKLSALTGAYTLDPARTRIGFTARHTMASRVHGHFTSYDAHAYLDAETPANSTIDLTIHTHSLHTRNPQRDQHLLTHFLSLADHPTITLTSTDVRRRTPTSFALTADLTIRGTTRPITLDLHYRATDDGPRLKAALTVNRHDWHVNWNAATTLLISPHVTLELDAIATRRP